MQNEYCCEEEAWGPCKTAFHYIKLSSFDKSFSSNTQKRKKNNIHDFI